MIEFFGNVYKHDLITKIAVSIRLLEDKKVSIVTDDDRHYRFFDGEIHGVTITKLPSKEAILVYDSHVVMCGEPEDNLVLVSDHSRTCVDLTRSIMSSREEQPKLILVDEDSGASRNYLDTFLGAPFASYQRNSRRLYDLNHDGLIKHRNFTPDFLKVVDKVLTGILGYDASDVKELHKVFKKGA